MRPLVAVWLVVSLLAGAALARRWLDAVVVRGESMAPTLRPGDRLIVEAFSLRRRAPRAGDVVLAPDPRAPEREIVKRVAAYEPLTGRVELRGDAPEASTDSRTFGTLPREQVQWRVAARYWPLDRARRF